MVICLLCKDHSPQHFGKIVNTIVIHRALGVTPPVPLPAVQLYPVHSQSLGPGSPPPPPASNVARASQPFLMCGSLLGYFMNQETSE